VISRYVASVNGEVTMYTLFRATPLSTLLATQAPTVFVCFVIAELFYKFHSFTLETLAFLATWFIIDAVVTTVRNMWMKRANAPAGSE
jgi:hypothetical protein